MPVIHVLNIGDGDEDERLACMAIILAHETVHTLGMDDVYNDNNHNPTVCLMSELIVADSDEIYQEILVGTTEPFCSSCEQAIRDHSEDASFSGNQ